MKETIRRTGTCPRCGREYTGHPAISRADNETLICPDCGTKEALESWVYPRMSKNRSSRRSTAALAI